MNNRKTVKVAVDLDGVIAQHSFGGFWVKVRRFKEKTLKKVHFSTYYYPSTSIEKIAWKIINGSRKPFLDTENFFPFLAGKKDFRFYIVTSRFGFLKKMTLEWLKKYGLNSFFRQVLINDQDENPLFFKEEAVKKWGFDFFIDDDLEVINYLKKKTKIKLYWVVPKHKDKSDNHDNGVITCDDFVEALQMISRDIV